MLFLLTLRGIFSFALGYFPPLQLYDGFIKSVEAKLSQLRAALLVSLIGYSFTDPHRATDFFTSVLENRTRLGVEACLCLEADIAVMHVRLGLNEEARQQLDKVEEEMQASGTGEAVVFSKVYRAMTEYRKVNCSSGSIAHDDSSRHQHAYSLLLRSFSYSCAAIFRHILLCILLCVWISYL